MEGEKNRVLLIEDNPGDARLIRELLSAEEGASFFLEHADRLSTGLARLAQGNIDVILLDLSLPDSHGLDSVNKICAQAPRVPVVVLSGLSDEAVAINAVQEGAQDYLVKGSVDSALLARSLHYAIERQHLRVAFRESEARYRLLADNAADLIWTANMKWEMTYVSPSVKRLLGYTVEEMKRLAIKDILTPDSLKQAGKLIRNQMDIMTPGSQYPPLSLTLEHVRKDGSTLWAEVMLSFLWDKDGKLSEILGVTREITERKKAEEALRHSEQRYRLLAENVKDVIWIMDMNLRLTYTSPSITQLTGYRPEEYITKPMEEGLTPASVEFVTNLFAEELALEDSGHSDLFRARTFEAELICKDGSIVPVEMKATALRDADGRPIGVLGVSRDISERKKAEEALRHSEQRYRLLAENVKDVIWIRDMNLRLTYTSPSVLEMSGYSVEEVMSMSLEESLTPASLEQLRPTLARVLAAGEKGQVDLPEVFLFEAELIHKGGTIMPVEMKINLLRNPDGQPIGYLGVIRDITARKKAEEALRESEEQFRTVFEGTSLGIALVDFNAKTLSINPAFERMLGYNLEEFKEIEGSLKYLHPDDAMVDAKLYIEMLKGKREHYTVDKRYIRKDGGVIWGRQNLSVVRGAGGKPNYFVAMVEDITARKKMEEALRQSEERNRELFENANDIIYTHDLAGNFTSINRAAELVTGYTREEVIGMNIARLLTPESMERARQMIARKVSDGGQTRYELEIVTKDGHKVLLEVNTRLVYEGGKPVGTQGIARDITERKKAENALRESEEKLRRYLESSPDAIYINDEKGMFLYGNLVAERVIGYPKEELIGHSFLELNILPPEYLGKAAQTLELNLAGKPTGPDEFELVRKDGSRVFVEISTYPTTHDDKVEVIGIARDITERKKLEQELLRLSDAVKMSKDGIAITDLEGRIIEVNEATLKMHGIDNRADLIGRPALELIAPEDHEMVTEKMTTALAEGGLPYILEYHCLKNDGSTFLCEATVSEVKDKTGEHTGYMAVVRDITERRRMEDALRESEEKYRLYFENASDVIYSLDPKGTIMSMSPVVEKMLGYKPEELIGKNIFEANLQTPETMEKALLNISRVLAGEHGLPTEGEFIAKDGTRIFGEISGAPIFSSDGKVIAIVCVGRDITERKRIHGALRTSEERLRIISENMNDLVSLVDAEGNYLYLSPVYKRMFGDDPDQDLGKNVIDFAQRVHPDDREKYVSSILGTVSNPISSSLQYRYKHASGNYIWVESQWSILTGENGQLMGAVIVNRDITERKRMEDALKQSEQDFRTLFDTTIDGIAVIDAETLKILLINQTIINKYGKNIVGMNPFDLLAPEDKERALKLLKEEVLEKDLHLVHEYRVIAKDGSELWISVVSTRTEFQGRPAVLVSIRNITEQKRAEEEVRRLSDAVRMSAESIFVADLEGRVVDANESAVKMFAAVDKSDLLGKGVLELIAPEDHEKAFENIKKGLEGEKVNPEEYCIVRKDGSRNLSELSASVLMGGDGKPTGFVVVGHDITERKRMENALRQSEQDYRTLFDTTIDGMAVIDAETMRVLLINQPIVQKYGSGLAEDIFKGNLLDFVHPEDRERALKLIVEDLFEKDLRELVKIRLINSDGKVFWASCTGARIKYQGRPAGLVSLRDITEQEEAENALRQSEQSYRVLLESTHDSIIVVDAETYKITFGNRRASVMFGFDPTLQDGVGANLLDFVHPEDREIAIKGFVEDLYQAERRRRYDVRAKTQDGREIWVSALGTRIEFQGRIAVLLSLRDVTKDKQMEEEKRKLEEQIQLAGRLAAVGELAAGVAHELNNPITAIKGYAQLLTKKKELDEPLRKDLETIYRESQRAARITQNLLSFARKHEPEKRLVSINEVIEKTLELRAHPMKVNKIELVVELASDLPKTSADFHQMQQVFVNIINNAEQAMLEAHGKGRLVVKTQKVRNLIQITFADDGPGISEENIKRIFDPFFTTKEVGKGTGLGLSICYGLVEAHGGRIYVRSKPQQGATFVVEIPIVSENELVAEAVLLNPGSRGGKWKKPRE